MVLVRLCSDSSGVVAAQEVAPLCLLDPLGAVEGDLVGFWCGAAGAGFVAAESLAVILAMMSMRHFFSVAVWVT